MKGWPVARPDTMSRESSADGPRDSRRALVVVPGEDLGVSEGHEAGHGVLVVDGRLKSTKQGRMNKKGNTVTVEPLHTTYMPRPGTPDRPQRGLGGSGQLNLRVGATLQLPGGIVYAIAQ